MDDGKLRALLTAVDCGSFSKAAAQLGYTQSAMTHLVNKLEAEIGCTLLERDSQGIRLTDAGRQLLPYIQNVVCACDTLLQEAAEQSDPRKRTLRIGCFASIARARLPELLRAFRAEHPEIQLDVLVRSEELTTALASGRIQLALVDEARAKGFDFQPLADAPLVAVVPPDFPWEGTPSRWSACCASRSSRARISISSRFSRRMRRASRSRRRTTGRSSPWSRRGSAWRCCRRSRSSGMRACARAPARAADRAAPRRRGQVHQCGGHIGTDVFVVPVRVLRTGGAPVIRNICTDRFFLMQPSEPATAADLPVAQDLRDTLAAHRQACVGMAANMIGVRRRIIIFDDNGTPTVMLNPVILRRTEPYTAEEGCLSLTGKRTARRWRSIKVQWQNERLQTRVRTFTGWTAQIIQHEIDHCDGVLI